MLRRTVQIKPRVDGIDKRKSKFRNREPITELGIKGDLKGLRRNIQTRKTWTHQIRRGDINDLLTVSLNSEDADKEWENSIRFLARLANSRRARKNPEIRRAIEDVLSGELGIERVTERRQGEHFSDCEIKCCGWIITIGALLVGGLPIGANVFVRALKNKIEWPTAISIWAVGAAIVTVGIALIAIPGIKNELEFSKVKEDQE